MESKFTVEEKRKWLLKKHIKDHAFEYVLDIVLTMLYTYILLKWCKAEDVILGMIIAFAWGLCCVIRKIQCYKKEYVNIHVK